MGLDKKILDAIMAKQMADSIKNAKPDYDPAAHTMHTRKAYTNASVVIIGAGISGMPPSPIPPSQASTHFSREQECAQPSI
jgi:hypothetical protein